jgi:hypothetical protein
MDLIFYGLSLQFTFFCIRRAMAIIVTSIKMKKVLAGYKILLLLRRGYTSYP